MCSGSLKGRSHRPGSGATRSAGSVPLRKLFSKDQRAFYKAHAPAGIDIDSLIAARADVRAQGGLPACRAPHVGLVAEVWLYPDGSRILELSTNCLPRRHSRSRRKRAPTLQARVYRSVGAQQTKTRTALEFFRSEMQASTAATAKSRI